MNKTFFILIFSVIFLNFNISPVNSKKSEVIYSDSFDHLYSLANFEASHNNNEKAFTYFEAIMQKFPDKIAALYSYKLFCINNGYYDKAIELNKFLYKKTGKESLKEELAYLYQKKGDVDKTINLYEKIIDKNPEKKSVQEKLITEFFNHGKFQKAAEYCESFSTLKNQKMAMTCSKSLFYSGNNYKALDIIEKYKLSNDLSFVSDVYLANQNFSKAIPYIEQLPSNTQKYKKLGELYTTVKNNKKAVENYELFLKYENNLNVKRKLADLYYSMNQLERANELYKEIYAENTSNKEILGYLIDINSALNNFDESIKYQKKLIELSDKENAKDLKLKLAGLYIANKEFKTAEQIFIELFSKNQNDIETLKNLININLAQNNHVEALNYLNHAILMEPENIELKLKLIDTMFAIGDPAAAGDILEELVKIKDNKELKIKLTDSYLASGQYEKAVKTLQPLVNRYPDDKNLKIKYADSLLALKNYDEAYEVLRPFLDEKKKDTELIKKLSNLLLTMKKFEQNEVLLNWAHKNNPENDDIKKLLADTNLYLENYEEALAYYNEISDKNKDENIIYAMAEANRFLQDYNKADELYDRLSKNEKYKIKAKIGKAYINIDRNKLYQAKKDFKEILELNKNNYEAKLGLAIAHNSTEDFLTGLEILDTLEENDKIRYEKGNAYFKMQMYSDALENLKNNKLLKAQRLQGRVLNRMEIRATPEFDFSATNFPQGGANPNTKLRFSSYGVEFSDYPQYLGLEKTNLKFKSRWNITPYYSGSGTSSRNALANYYSVGFEGRPYRNLATDNEFGLKFFNTGDGLIEAKSLWDIHVNDTVKLHFGYERFNIEETLLSTAGIKPATGPFAGMLVGQAVNNKFKLFGYTLRFPYDWFSYGSYSLGNISGINIADNSYSEGVIGLGKVLYTRPEGRLLDLIMPEYTFYYTGYDKNLLGFGGASLNSNPVGSSGISPFTSPLVGGYFSPEYLISNQIALHLRGTIKKLNTKYYLIGFTGLQNVANNSMDITWGARIKLTYNEEGPFGLAISYGIQDYDVIMKHYIMAQVLTRW